MQPNISHADTSMTSAQRLQGRVISHAEVSPAYWQLTLQCKDVATSGRPGQFVHILPPRASFDPLLRRAFSIFQTEGDTFKVLYRAAGKGTRLLSKANIGDVIDLIGPLGQPFHIDNRQSTVILVGGGVGVPPLVFLAGRLLNAATSNTQSNPDITVLVGARSRTDVLGTNELAHIGIQTDIATEDGSAGHQGLVTDLLRRNLESPQQAGDQGKQSAIVYACGPLPMLRAVAKMCADFKVLCQVSLEENMPCGIGVCNGCVVPVVKAGDDYGLYRRICVEGPVLWSHEVDWDQLGGH